MANNSVKINNDYGNSWTLSIDGWESSYSIPNNTSNVYVKATLASGSASWTNTNGVNDVLRAYIDYGSGWVEVASAGRTSMGYNTSFTAETTKSIGHSSDGTKSVRIKASWSEDSNNPWSPNSGSVETGWFSLTNIPRQANLTSASNFNDEEKLTVEYSNPAGSSVTSLSLGIFETDGTTSIIGYKSVSKTGSSYTWNFSDSERDALRLSCRKVNSKKIRVYLRTVIGGNTFLSYKTVTLSIINAKPTIGDFTYRDTSSTSYALTGDRSILIEGHSKPQVNIPASSAMVAYKKALKKSIVGSLSGMSNGIIAYDEDAEIDGYGTFTLSGELVSGTQTLRVVATDSRGNQAVKTKNVVVIPYSEPELYFSATRLNDFENQTTISIGGSLSPVVVNGVRKNQIVSITYEYKETSASQYGTPVTVSASLDSDNNIVVNDFVLDFDNTKSYQIRVTVQDKLSTVSQVVTVSEGIAVFRIGTDGYVYNQEKKLVTEDRITQMLLDKIYPVGSIYISMTNKSPQTFLGGTWSRIAQGRTMVGVNEDDTTFSTVRKTGGSKTHKLTVNEMPSHNHPLNGDCDYVGIDGTGGTAYGLLQGGKNYRWKIGQQNVGGSAAHNNLQPYITTYMWERKS